MKNNNFNDDETISFLEGFNQVLSPEEIENRKNKEKLELLKQGFLPKNDEYNETMRSSMEMVEKNPKRFIIEECIPVVKNYGIRISIHLWLVII